MGSTTVYEGVIYAGAMDWLMLFFGLVYGVAASVGNENYIGALFSILAIYGLRSFGFMWVIYHDDFTSRAIYFYGRTIIDGIISAAYIGMYVWAIVETCINGRWPIFLDENATGWTA